MDAITSEQISGFVAKRQADEVGIATINRELATLRRMFHLSQEWGKVDRVLPRVKLLAGENHRERVLSPEEEAAYLDAVTAQGNEIQQDFIRSLQGIRAVKRGQQPKTPDPFLLRDVVTILLDCAYAQRSASGFDGRTISAMERLKFTPERAGAPDDGSQRLRAPLPIWICGRRLAV